MTTMRRTTVDCDFENCSARSEHTVAGASKARKEATAAGWRRWADVDLCPAPKPGDVYYTDEYYRPRGHADLLTGEHEPTLVRMPPAYSWSNTPQWRVTCACGWDGETPRYNRKYAAQSWSKHVYQEMKRATDG